MTYSTFSEVQKEAGNIDKYGITQTDIDPKIEAADQIIRNITHHSWQVGEPSYKIVQECSKLMSAAMVQMMMNDPDFQAQAKWDFALKLLEPLVHTDEISEDITVIKKEYKTWPKNPEAVISRGRLTPTPINKAFTIDPDEIYQD